MDFLDLFMNKSIHSTIFLTLIDLSHFMWYLIDMSIIISPSYEVTKRFFKDVNTIRLQWGNISVLMACK